MTIEEQLVKAAERYAKDRARIEAQEAAAAERRDGVVRAAAAAGLTRRRIAKLLGVSHQRVDQIVRGTR